MRYKNNKTGAVVDSSFKISGDDWKLEEVTTKEKEKLEKVKEIDQIKKTKEIEKPEEPKEPKELKEPEKVEEPEKNFIENEPEEDDGFNGITIKQIKQELDAFGIKYDPKAKKDVLYNLMMQGK